MSEDTVRALDPTTPAPATGPATRPATDPDTEGHFQPDHELVVEPEIETPTGTEAVSATGADTDDDRDTEDEAGEEHQVRAGSSELHQRTVELFSRMGEGTEAERATLRGELVELHLPLAEYLARRFGNRGEPHEDLVQVATIGLIKAIDRFDLERGVAFSTYATPTIVGEIKRHFRDRGWTIRVPRRLQEIQAVINQAVSDLGQELGRSPTVSELATRVGMSEEEILEGLESANAYSPLSLDAPDPSGELGAVIDQLGDYDDALDAVIDRETVKPLLDRLDARAKRILLLRFFRNMTQSQIAEELGISQMHVSRLLSRTLADLRRALDEASSASGS
jgi:RNA polymerase sigma-B factor